MNDLTLTATDEELLQSFLSLSTREDVAALLEIDYYRLNYHLHIADRHREVYTTFSV